MPPENHAQTAGFAVQMGIVILMVSLVGMARTGAMGPQMGDLVTIPGNVVIGPGDYRAEAVLPSGQHCQIGVGVHADTGGSLMVVGRSPNGDIIAAWASAGHSARTGDDCGPHDVRLSIGSYLSLLQAARTRPPEGQPAGYGGT